MKHLLALGLIATLTVGCLPNFYENTNPVIYDLEWSPNSNELLVSGSELQLYTDDFQQITTFETGRYNSQIVAWGPDGKTLAEAGCELKLWDVDAQEITYTTDGHKCISVMAWSPDGTKIATGKTDNTIRILDRDSLEVVDILDGHTTDISSIIWESEGDNLLSSSHNGEVRLWSINTGKILWSINLPEIVYSVALSPDEKWLAMTSWDSDVQLWDFTTKQQHSSLQASNNSISAHTATWNPNGAYIATASLDSIQVWEFTTGEILFSGSTEGARIDSLAWNFDGGMLASASRDNKLRVWNPKTAELIFEGELPHT